MKRARVVVTGSVQGVFFRATCAARARERGVAGWVRNRSDGGVEAEFEGDGPAVDEMIEWCRRGPGLARVDSLEISPVTATGEQGFRIVG